MSWFIGKQCEVCKRPIVKGWFWQPKPRLVGPDGQARDAAYVSEADAAMSSATELLACGPCYFDHFGDVRAAARAKAGGTPPPTRAS
jgi:hypothetical protein